MMTEQGTHHSELGLTSGKSANVSPQEGSESALPGPLQYIVEQDIFEEENFHPFSRIVHQDGTEVGILGVTLQRKEDQRLIVSPTMTSTDPQFPPWVDATPQQLMHFVTTGDRPVDIWQFNHQDGIRRARGIPGGSDLVTLFPNEGDTTEEKILYAEQELIKGILATSQLEVPEQIGMVANNQIVQAPITDDGLMPLFATQIGHHVLVFGDNTNGKFGASEAEFRKFASDLHTILFPENLTETPLDPEAEGWLRLWLRRVDVLKRFTRSRVQNIPSPPDFKTAPLHEIQAYFAHFVEFEETDIPAEDLRVPAIIRESDEEVVQNNMRVEHLYDLDRLFDHVSGNFGMIESTLYRFDESGMTEQCTVPTDTPVCPLDNGQVAYLGRDNKIRVAQMEGRWQSEIIYHIHPSAVDAHLQTTGNDTIVMLLRTTSGSDPQELAFYENGKWVDRVMNTRLQLDMHTIAPGIAYVGPKNKSNNTNEQGIYQLSNGTISRKGGILDHLQVDSVSPGYGGIKLISGINTRSDSLRDIVLFNTGSNKENKRISLPKSYSEMIPRMAMSGNQVCMLLATGSPATLQWSQLASFDLEVFRDGDIDTLVAIEEFDYTHTSISLSQHDMFRKGFPQGATQSIQMRPLNPDQGEFLLLAGSRVFKVSTAH